ncbi:Hypothetical protein I595_260 [Croceitalea dokdonensis DOKDO 023]|uniref:LVIVD repeat-containing protein n=1 Tax=Croceitalea dokdonensis DOKDO 023 TaxID=1300341 RepID=A0A0P7B3Z5_9FLAO|nr:hypothetical protein [Croceitalea dokdonensis]KPM33357.1 Hypothetical protein I595_260 [Croceitalea dokdonensis DOKDO 023]
MRRILLYSSLLLFFAACSDTTTVFENEENLIQLETNATVLENSLSYDNSGVLDIYEEELTTNKSARFVEERAGDYPLSLVASIRPPSFNGGENLTASHVDLVGEYAYVAYNTVEDGYAGGLDIVDISDPDRPRVTSRLYYLNADINSLKFSNGFLYAVGGFDSEQSATITSNSFVAKIMVQNGRFNLAPGISYGFQEGFNANDVAVTATSVFMTSGRDGYVTEFDKSTLEIINETPFQDLRSIAIRDSKIMVLDADFGVRILDSELNETNQIPINSDFRLADKRTLDFYNETLVVAEGERGAGLYDTNSGNLLQYIDIPLNPNDALPEEVVTNATAFNDGVLLMANGGAGLCISEEVKGEDLTGIIELNGSINYVATKGDYIFAASGTEGLQIIKMNKPSADLASRCADTPNYAGSTNLRVGAAENLAYSGSRRFRNVSVDGQLLLCGTWTVNNQVDISANGSFAIRGTFIVARNNRRRNLVVGANARLQIEGNLTIYGDLVLGENATVEFLGDTSRANIFGNVVMGSGAAVTGNYDDIQDKF